VTSSQVRSRISRILIASITGLVLAAAVLVHPGHGRGAAGLTQGSSRVAVIPGFAPKAYPGTNGVPALPATSPQLASYHFTQLPADQVTSASLSTYDTVFLYGIRWGDIPAAGQAAINAFATTHKVVIWDADDTGAQKYSTFVRPFSSLASGENGPPGASVVSYPAGTDFLASDNPSSPYYLDPNQLVADKHMINHMNAMRTGTANWAPALLAANGSIPKGGWVVAWSYGNIPNGTGLLVYSGIDSDGMADGMSPNYAVKELALDLAAPFRQTPNSSCAPQCKPPSSGGGGQTYAACSFAKPLPKHWVRRNIVVTLKTSVAAGITGHIVTGSGRVVASGREVTGDLVRLVVPTRKLPSNRISRLRALIRVNGQQACTKRFRLKVDNVKPRLLLLSTTGTGVHLLTLSVSELSSMSIVGRNVHRRPVLIAARRTIRVHLSASVRTARLILTDRAGNTLVRRLVW
jgi:hypothetical protein